MSTRKCILPLSSARRIGAAIIVLGLSHTSSFAQYLGPAPTLRVHSQVTTNPADLKGLLSAPEPAKILHVDDTVAIQVYGVKEFDFEQRVGANGTITLPLVGPVQAQGKTVEELQSEIATVLKNGELVQDPQVTAKITAQPSLKVTVTGEVAHPGTFSAFGSHTLSDYLAQAGGLKETGSTTVSLWRRSLTNPVSIPLGIDSESQGYGDVPIFPGDEIRVGKVGVVYAVGALKNQGSYNLKNTTPLTVIDAIALAGGVGYEAAYSDSRIYRVAGDKRIELKIDVGRIMRGQTEDIALKADDILMIPTNKLKAAIKGGGSSLAVSLASAYIYARP